MATVDAAQDQCTANDIGNVKPYTGTPQYKCKDILTYKLASDLTNSESGCTIVAIHAHRTSTCAWNRSYMHDNDNRV